MAVKHKLDMFKEVLPNLDCHKTEYYSTLSDDQKKGFAGVVAMRFMSSASGDFADWYLVATNQRANVHFHEMHKHPELQWKLLASNGHGRRVSHSWIGQSRNTSSALLHDFIVQYWPQVNTLEVDTILGQFTQQEFYDFVDGTGAEKDDAKKIKNSFDARTV